MKKIVVILIGIILAGLVFSGCVRVPEGKITLTVDNVEKRHYDDNGDPASSNTIFVYTFFTIQNEAIDELSTSILFFKLSSPLGKTYSPKWFFGSGGSEATAVSKGASASYNIAFEVDEDEIPLKNIFFPLKILLFGCNPNISKQKSHYILLLWMIYQR